MVGKHGAMMLFVGRLPESITRRELKAFIQNTVRSSRKGRFAARANVSNCAIVRLTDRANGTCEYHGLVEIQPAKAGMHVIECLNGAELKGARIEVRRYHHRSLLRERRQANDLLGGPDGRSKERRRKTLKIDMVEVVKVAGQREGRLARGGRRGMKIDLIGV